MQSLNSAAFFPLSQQLPATPKREIAPAVSKHTNEPVEWADDVQTVMIRGIPCSCKRDEILRAIEEVGFREQHDFFYVPTRRGRILGYAFVGYPNPQVAKKFAGAMTGYVFKGKVSAKTVTVTPASIQGLRDNLEHFKDTSVMQSSARPVFVSTKE